MRMTCGLPRLQLADSPRGPRPGRVHGAGAEGRPGLIDPLEQMALAERADRQLLRAVALAAAAILAVAVSGALV